MDDPGEDMGLQGSVMRVGRQRARGVVDTVSLHRDRRQFVRVHADGGLPDLEGSRSPAFRNFRTPPNRGGESEHR